MFCVLLKTDCYFEYLKFQKKNGIENPNVPLRIEYRRSRNKTIPKIMWKPPEGTYCI